VASAAPLYYPSRFMTLSKKTRPNPIMTTTLFKKKPSRRSVQENGPQNTERRGGGNFPTSKAFYSLLQLSVAEYFLKWIDTH
jgi:hypothetical protein